MTTATGHQASPVSCAGATRSNIARQCRSVAILHSCPRTAACWTVRPPVPTAPGPTATGPTRSPTCTSPVPASRRAHRCCSSMAATGARSTTAPTCARWPSRLAAAGPPDRAPRVPPAPGRPDASVDAVRAALAAVTEVVDAAPAARGPLGRGAPGPARGPARGTAARGVLALAPLADLAMADRLGLDGGAVREFLGRPAVDCPDLDPVALPAPAVPVTVIHGARDTLVPLAISESYCAAHPRPPRGARRHGPLRAHRPGQPRVAVGDRRTVGALPAIGY